MIVFNITEADGLVRIDDIKVGSLTITKYDERTKQTSLSMLTEFIGEHAKLRYNNDKEKIVRIKSVKLEEHGYVVYFDEE